MNETKYDIGDTISYYVKKQGSKRGFHLKFKVVGFVPVSFWPDRPIRTYYGVIFFKFKNFYAGNFC